jgi:hypothetical protein
LLAVGGTALLVLRRCNLAAQQTHRHALASVKALNLTQKSFT